MVWLGPALWIEPERQYSLGARTECHGSTYVLWSHKDLFRMMATNNEVECGSGYDGMSPYVMVSFSLSGVRSHMRCKGAEGACNNACYHVNCVEKSTAKMVYDSKNKNEKNREQPGCQTKEGSVCNSLPFSQKLHDPLKTGNPGTEFNCNEWPMVSIKRDDFQAGKVRNGLRCITKNENSSK